MSLIHDFRLLPEQGHTYQNLRNFAGRHDAPVQLHDDLISYLWDTFLWIPTLNPSQKERSTELGLNRWGKTIINDMGGATFMHVCLSWAQLFANGPEQLILRGPTSFSWPFEEEERLLREDQISHLMIQIPLVLDRKNLVNTLKQLAQFGAQAATGDFFILHLGV